MTENKMGAKIAAWTWALFDSFGVLTAIMAFVNVDAFEKFILFLASLVYFSYRIYQMHLDSVDKELEIKKKKKELAKK